MQNELSCHLIEVVLAEGGVDLSQDLLQDSGGDVAVACKHSIALVGFS